MSKTEFKLPKNKSLGKTYENIHVTSFPNDIVMATIDRGLYLDQHHEVNLCIHFNRKTPETYDFDFCYTFYEVDGRFCDEIFRQFGNPDENKILKKYSSCEEAEESEYYEYFSLMKDQLDKKIAEEKDFVLQRRSSDMEWGRCSYLPRVDLEGGIYNFFLPEIKEYVYLEVDLLTDNWFLISCKQSLENFKIYFKDYIEIDKKFLHIINYHEGLDVKNMDNSNPYYEVIEFAKKDLGLIGGVVPGFIDAAKIKYMEYWHINSQYDCYLGKLKCLHKKKTRFELNGHVTERIFIENEIKVKKLKKVIKDPSEIKELYSDVAAFLSSGMLKKCSIYDDCTGWVKIKFIDNHVEKYYRGLTKKSVTLWNFFPDYFIKDD